jgi:cell division transport system ATP-binding protein
MIEFKDVSVYYNGGKNQDDIALDNISLIIEDGEFVSIIGQSGAGKSTLLRLIFGEIKPDKGDVAINDIKVSDLKPKVLPLLRRHIGVVFQDYKLLNNRSVYDNVALALLALETNPKEIPNKVKKALDKVGLTGKGNRFPSELSGGEQQRVSIARAMVHEPSVLVADECTGNLDKINTYDVINLLLDINKTGTTVIIATHDQDIVNSLKKRVITIVDGKISRDQKNEGQYFV